MWLQPPSRGWGVESRWGWGVGCKGLGAGIRNWGVSYRSGSKVVDHSTMIRHYMQIMCVFLIFQVSNEHSSYQSQPSQPARWCAFYKSVFFLAYRTQNVGLFLPIYAIFSRIYAPFCVLFKQYGAVPKLTIMMYEYYHYQFVGSSSLAESVTCNQLCVWICFQDFL